MKRNKILLAGLVLCLLGLGWLVMGAEDPSEQDRMETPNGELDDPARAAVAELELASPGEEPAERMDVRKLPLRVQVLDARTLEPIVGASVELRSGDPKYAKARSILGSDYLQANSKRHGRLEFTATRRKYIDNYLPDQLEADGGELLSDAISGEGGWAEVERSEMGTHLWAEKDEASGWTTNIGNADSVTLLIEHPINLQVQDANGITVNSGPPYSRLKVGDQTDDGSIPAPIGGGYWVSHGLWGKLRKQLTEDQVPAGIYFSLVLELAGDPVFLPLDREPPNPVVLREAPFGTIEILAPWAGDGMGSELQLQLGVEGQRGGYRGGKRPFLPLRFPLNLDFELSIFQEDKPDQVVDFAGPTQPNEKLTLELPAPDKPQAIEGEIGIVVDEGVRVPSTQNALIVMEHAVEEQIVSGPDGEFSLSPPFRQGSGDTVQFWMEREEGWYSSMILDLREGSDQTFDLGSVLLRRAEPTVALEVRSDTGEMLAQARVIVQERVAGSGSRKWIKCSRLRVYRNKETGLIEYHGPSDLRLLRFRVRYLFGYADSDWVEVQPGAGLSRITMKSTR